MGTVEYVLQREVPDHRDHPYRAPDHVIRALPDQVDLRPDPWPVWDQVAHNSCTANVLAAAMQLLLMKEKRKEAFEPSRLFIYYNEREIEGNQTWDAPVYMRDGIQSLRDTGVCPEPLWPQDPSSVNEKPSDDAYTAAKKHRAVAYRKVPHDLPHMLGCLATGYPFTIGIQVYLSYEFAMATGDIQIPEPATEMYRGGHALLVVGYDNAKGFLVRNSEGDHWGDGGYGWLPHGYATDDKLADSLWTLRYAT